MLGCWVLGWGSGNGGAVPRLSGVPWAICQQALDWIWDAFVPTVIPDDPIPSHDVYNFISIKHRETTLLQFWIFWTPGYLTLAWHRASISRFFLCNLVWIDAWTLPVWTVGHEPCIFQYPLPHPALIPLSVRSQRDERKATAHLGLSPKGCVVTAYPGHYLMEVSCCSLPPVCTGSHRAVSRYPSPRQEFLTLHPTPPSPKSSSSLGLCGSMCRSHWDSGAVHCLRPSCGTRLWTPG